MYARRLTSIINVLAVIATIAVNGLANALPINGQTTGEISDRFAVFFVPAGYVFSIWGLIYMGLIAFAIYQALPANRGSKRLAPIGLWFALSCAANILWIVLWHYEAFVLTVPVMLVLLVSLIVIYQRLGIGRKSAPSPERWCVDVPFSIYLGWITVATVANITSVLYYLGWGGWGIAPHTWALIMLVIAAALAVAMSVSRRDVSYVLVIIWALVGIAVKHSASPVIAVASLVLSVAALVPTGARLLARTKSA